MSFSLEEARVSSVERLLARRVSPCSLGLVTRSFGCSLSLCVSLSLLLSRFYGRIELMIVVSGFCGFFVPAKSGEVTPRRLHTPSQSGLYYILVGWLISCTALGANFGNNLAFIASSWLHVAFPFALCDVQLARRASSPRACLPACLPGCIVTRERGGTESRRDRQTGTLPQQRFRFAVSQIYCQLPAAPTMPKHEAPS